MTEEKKTIMTAICRNGKLTIFDNNGYYVSQRVEGELYNYSSEFVTIYLKRTNQLKVYDIKFYLIKTIDLNSSNY